MSATTAALDEAIDAFLTDRLDFQSFWRSFMDRWANGGLSVPELAASPCARHMG